MTKNTTVIILAAGLGTRMRSSKAKVLHRAGGDTILNQVIRAALHVTTPENIVVVVGHQAEAVRQSVTVSGIRFAEQMEQKGTGHAVMCAVDQVPQKSGSLLILNGDGPLLKAGTVASLLQLHNDRQLGGAIVTTLLADPTGYGRIMRGADGLVASIVEQKSATPDQLAVREVNPGVYCFDAERFWAHVNEIRNDNAAHEYYLTDMVEILTQHGAPIAPMLIEDETELLGINTRVELAIADTILRERKTRELMLSGVTIESPHTVIIDADVEVGQDTVIEANVQLRGNTRVAANCHIGTGSVLRDCTVGEAAHILPYVVAEASAIGTHAHVGPFARLRMKAQAEEGTHIGNFVELKNTRLGKGSKASHLTYLGDSQIGAKVNVGAGTITCNYDGHRKHATVVEDGAFVGSNSTLIAPVTIGSGAYVAAGSVVTKSVSPDALAIGRAHQQEKPHWAKHKRELMAAPPSNE